MTAGELPTFDELPNFHNYTGCAWDVWGKDDQLGTINLLTEDVVREAAQEIKCAIEFHFCIFHSRDFEPSRLGKTICLNWYDLWSI